MKYTFFLILSLFFGFAVGQNETEINYKPFPNFDDSPRGNEGIRIMFYNVENYFDIYDDSLKRDDEYTPKGTRFWSWGRFEEKKNNIAKVISAVGGFEPVDIVGLCEIENRYVLENLIGKSGIKNQKFNIIHEESPDNRGIDVALLYRSEKFKPLLHEAINVSFPNDTTRKTRDILYVKGLALDSDTLHIFVNHWPSRWGGMLESEEGRIIAAKKLRQKVDSIFIKNNDANIIIMGDFNDEPDNVSLNEYLKATSKETLLDTNLNLVNLMYEKMHIEGSHKFQDKWGILDMFIVSKNLLNENFQKVQIKNFQANIFRASFLLEPDDTFLGEKPYRTYIGFRFNGGFSDHLPIYIDLFKRR